MIQRKFSKKVAKDTLSLLHEKGWNLYRTDGAKSLKANEIIRRQHLANKIEVEVPYMMLPIADDTGVTFEANFVKFHTVGFETYVSYIELPYVLKTLINAR